MRGHGILTGINTNGYPVTAERIERLNRAGPGGNKLVLHWKNFLWGSKRFGRFAFDLQSDFGARYIPDLNFVTVLVATLVHQFLHAVADLI